MRSTSMPHALRIFVTACAWLGVSLPSVHGQWSESAVSPPLQGFRADRLVLAPDADDGLVVSLPETLGPGGWGLTATLDHADGVLVAGAGSEAERTLLAQRTLVQVSLAYGFGSRLQMHARVPVVLRSTGDDLVRPYGEVSPSRGFAPGDSVLGGTLRLFTLSSYQLSAGLGGELVLPTGARKHFSGDLGLGPRAWASLSLRPAEGWQIAAQAGAVYRPVRILEEHRIGYELEFRGGVFHDLAQGLRLGLETLVTRPLRRRSEPVATGSEEVLAGIRYRAPFGLVVGTALGAGPVNRGNGTPRWRLVFTLGGSASAEQASPVTPSEVGVSEGSPAAAQPAEEAEPVAAPPATDPCAGPAADRPADCPSGDGDGDGVADVDDACPGEAEDADGHEDEDGCPELDNDADGIVDSADACPGEPEDRDGVADEDGCPDLDDDGDGVADAQDRCPGEAEDRDGFQDDDGCPDPDNDGDGVLDGEDKCPVVAGLAVHAGCLKLLTLDAAAGRLRTSTRVRFRTKRAALRRSSLPVLVELAALLKARPDLGRLRVDVFSQAAGDAEGDVALSLRRARKVRAALVAAGLEAGRVRVRGRGRARSDASAGRPNRVEFHLPALRARGAKDAPVPEPPASTVPASEPPASTAPASEPPASVDPGPVAADPELGDVGP